MNQSGVRLPPVLVLEFPSANRTLEGGIFPALDPLVFLQWVPPHVSVSASEARPGFPVRFPGRHWKERPVIVKLFPRHFLIATLKARDLMRLDAARANLNTMINNHRLYTLFSNKLLELGSFFSDVWYIYLVLWYWISSIVACNTKDCSYRKKYFIEKNCTINYHV